MDLDQDRVTFALEGGDHAVRGKERALGLESQVGPPKDREDPKLEALGLDDEVVPSRATRRQVGRTAHAVDLGNLVLPAALVPHVVAQGDGVYSIFQERAGKRSGDPGPGGDVFGIGDREVDAEFTLQPGQFLGDDVTTGTPNDVADEKKLKHKATVKTSPRGSESKIPSLPPALP